MPTVSYQATIRGQEAYQVSQVIIPSIKTFSFISHGGIIAYFASIAANVAYLNYLRYNI